MESDIEEEDNEDGDLPAFTGAGAVKDANFFCSREAEDLDRFLRSRF